MRGFMNKQTLEQMKQAATKARYSNLDDGPNANVGAVWVDVGGGEIPLTEAENDYIETVTPCLVLNLIEENERLRQRNADLSRMIGDRTGAA